MTPKQRADAERIIKALQHLGNEEEEAAMLLAELLAAATVGACRCGDRPAAACPGEWEPGCDLGANAKYARAVDPGPAVQALTTEPLRCPTDNGLCGAGGYCRPEPQGEVARLRADAECFRWLLAGNGYFMEHEMLCGHKPCSEEEQDDARRVIRAAMEEETP